MMSDVPFGVFLSGGVDSSTNVALMSELMDGAGAHVLGRLRASTSATTSSSTRGRSRGGSAPTTTRSSSTSDDLESFLPELIYHQDEPLADWVAVPLHYVSKLARDNGTIVVQIGEGSDELFHGYQCYISHARFTLALLGAVPARAAAAAPTGSAARPTSLRAQLGALRRACAGDRGCRRRADAVLGRGDRLPGRAQGARPLERPRRTPTRTRSSSGSGSEAERELPGADLLQKMTLPRAEEPARRAAADAGRQDDDGELGRGARAVPRPSTSSSSRWRCRRR